MRVAITGGSGFLGTNLMLYLRRTEPETEIVIVDIAMPRAAARPQGELRLRRHQEPAVAAARLRRL